MDVSSAGAGPDTRGAVLTVSASYGAGGSVIAPMLAGRLHLPFIDRLLSADISQEAARSATEDATLDRSGEHLTDAEASASPGSRFFSFLAWGAGVSPVSPLPPAGLDDDEARRELAERALAPVHAGGGGVILGRAGAVLLAERARTYHVRLDGRADRRARAAAVMEGITEAQAAERRDYTDRARDLWVKRLYRADVTNPRWYHLWVDTTVLDHGDAVDLIHSAFVHFLEQGPGAFAGP